MNRETKKLLEYIDNSIEYKDKLTEIQTTYPNFRDFYNQVGYIIMDIVNTNKQFHNLSRNNIEIELITERFFGWFF